MGAIDHVLVELEDPNGEPSRLEIKEARAELVEKDKEIERWMDRAVENRRLWSEARRATERQTMEIAEKDARIERLTRANENLKSALRTGIVKAVELELAEDALSGTPTTAKLVPVERLPVPPKPTPPPLRVFREGDMPEKADRAS
jgi:hypothetical protein